jgi:transposase
MKRFQGAMREQQTLMPHDLSDWLPENHLARFIVDLTGKLDFTSAYRSYQGKGTAAYDPRLLFSLLCYGYATGVFSSRKIEAATYDSVAFRFIAGNYHPDHDTIAAFRKRFLKEISGWFTQVLLIGKELGLVKLGTIYIDGTKIQANASRHKAMSYAYMNELESKLEAEVKRLLELADEQDEKEKDQQLDIPEELRLRKDRLEKIKRAKEVIDQRARERHEQEKVGYEQQKRRDAQVGGGKTRGRKPKPPEQGPGSPLPGDQMNFSDPESRIMKTSRGFEQCYNAQAAVNEDMLIIAGYSNAHVVDRREFLPVIEKVIGQGLGTPVTAVADAGYLSQHNVEQAGQLYGVQPLIAVGRQKHNCFLDQQLQQTPLLPGDDSALGQMKHQLRCSTGKAIYSKRKLTVEPVFGIIKEVLGFRRFSLRGEFEACGEWLLVCLAYNLKRLFKLKMAC